MVVAVVVLAAADSVVVSAVADLVVVVPLGGGRLLKFKWRVQLHAQTIVYLTVVFNNKLNTLPINRTIYTK